MTAYRSVLFSVIGALLASLPLKAEPTKFTEHGVILQYHHVSTSMPASTSISPEDFERHMAYLDEHHQVIPLKVMVELLQDGQPLPPKAVAITFDDGYRNILDNGHPILKEYDFPYTIFINPALIGTSHQQLDWKQVKAMAKENVTFANHTTDHRHLLARQDGESQQAWLNRVSEDLIAAERQIEQQLGYSLNYLAYPYGEFNQDIQALIEEMGYVGFGQHSGAIASYSDFTALPRYPAAGNYSNLNTLKLKLNSLAMPITSEPPKAALAHQHSAPEWSITLDLSDIRPHQFACYFGGDTLSLKWQEEQVQISLPESLSPGRSRVNCTAPSKRDHTRYYWYSQPFFVPTADGRWLD
ncbi:hypothetical protein HMF8227_00083 [Saliniradius amylolyticus]|uniref:NodB homology domain-containing protein n=1 Tax=Saliniradius amylolyticus TaxID=2183582 RepID=A0A2S2DYW5_9ALTE|nr:polysaccharide deacetylase family protein [Saliniradius amylolyticus]AWL10591.1 hypothetical protein HMF8227_00083 [Saliniradius amylolyticus]